MRETNQDIKALANLDNTHAVSGRHGSFLSVDSLGGPTMLIELLVTQ